MKERLRYIWHELYYKLTPSCGVNFAMTCKQATEMIDLHKRPSRRINRFRLGLHLSICQACNSYFKSTQALRRILRELMKNSERSVDIDQLNQELLKKYGKGHDARSREES